MPKYYYHYFDMKGRGEIVRLLFAAADVEYGENIVQLDDWPNQKPKHPLGQLPVLEIDGKPFPESIAISRHLAREFNLVGSNNLENLMIDVIVEQVLLLRETFCDAHFEEDKEKQKQLQTKFRNETLPRVFGYIENTITTNSTKSGFVVGDRLTWGDLALIDICDIISRDKTILDPFEVIREHRKKIESLPRIATYLKSRPHRDI